MARITVEDCSEIIQNRFELVVLAAQRAKVISSGAPIMVERENDKNAVIALREIGDRKLDVESLKELAIQSFQKRSSQDLLENEKIVDEDPQSTEDIAAEFGDEIVNFDDSDTSEDIDLGFGDDDISFAEDNIDTED